MTDDRPEPRYGQYAPGPPPAPPEPAVELPPPTGAPVVRKRRTWDLVLTTGLLLVGVYDVVTGFSTYANLGVPLRIVFEQQGIGAFTSDAAAVQVGLFLNVLRVILIAVAIIVSLVLISRHRLAFWAALGAGVLAGLAAIVCAMVLVVNDPAFIAYVESMQQ